MTIADRTDAGRTPATPHAALGRLLRELDRLPHAVRRARAASSTVRDPVSLDRLLASRARAADHARHAATALDGGGDRAAGRDALADIHELVDEVRAGLASPRLLDDLGEMMEEAASGPARRPLRVLDQRVRRIGGEADRLFDLATASATDTPPGAAPLDAVAEAVRQVAEAVVAALAGRSSTPPARPSPGRRFAEVADLIAASLKAYGLPHDGVGLPALDSLESARAQVVAALRRAFDVRDLDGTRDYFRSRPHAADAGAPAPHRGDPEPAEKPLRGSALVHVDRLRAEIEGVLAILDRLPELLRFVPAARDRIASSRARLREELDRLLVDASDPSAGHARSAAAARLEDVLAAAGEAAALLGQALSRFGTSPAEQEVSRMGQDDADARAGLPAHSAGR